MENNQEKKIKSQLEEGHSKKVFSTCETVLLVIASLLTGLFIGFLCSKHNIILKKTEIQDPYIREFAKNYNYIISNYYEEVDKQSLINGAISGMMESLNDPYSVYIDEDEYGNFAITLDGSYEGIGVQVAKEEKTGRIIITGVIKDSPALEAGLVPGDIVLKIDEKNASELSLDEFSNIVRYGEKVTHNLKILRKGEELDVTLARKIITLSSVDSKVYDIDNKKVGYIYIGIFANNTYSQFKDALEKLENEGIKYLIIDVRSNTGGHLTSVDRILDIFIDKNHIMYQFEQAGKKSPVYGTGDDKKDYEIILLGDEVSASASEVLIAGLRENLNAKFIGKKTYGKGTVQELVTLSDGSKYKITINKWLTPNGNWINETEGIIPDIEVELGDKYYETFDESDDTQLQAALNYTKK